MKGKRKSIPLSENQLIQRKIKYPNDFPWILIDYVTPRAFFFSAVGCTSGHEPPMTGQTSRTCSPVKPVFSHSIHSFIPVSKNRVYSSKNVRVVFLLCPWWMDRCLSSPDRDYRIHLYTYSMLQQNIGPSFYSVSLCKNQLTHLSGNVNVLLARDPAFSEGGL